MVGLWDGPACSWSECVVAGTVGAEDVAANTAEKDGKLCDVESASFASIAGTKSSCASWIVHHSCGLLSMHCIICCTS